MLQKFKIYMNYNIITIELSTVIPQMCEQWRNQGRGLETLDDTILKK